jgi:hypothetical protein
MESLIPPISKVSCIGSCGGLWILLPGEGIWWRSSDGSLTIPCCSIHLSQTCLLGWRYCCCLRQCRWGNGRLVVKLNSYLFFGCPKNELPAVRVMLDGSVAYVQKLSPIRLLEVCLLSLWVLVRVISACLLFELMPSVSISFQRSMSRVRVRSSMVLGSASFLTISAMVLFG